jgi:hypothetical protein
LCALLSSLVLTTGTLRFLKQHEDNVQHGHYTQLCPLVLPSRRSSSFNHGFQLTTQPLIFHSLSKTTKPLFHWTLSCVLYSPLCCQIVGKTSSPLHFSWLCYWERLESLLRKKLKTTKTNTKKAINIQSSVISRYYTSENIILRRKSTKKAS